MPSQIRLPACGEGVVEARISRWLKRPGELVRAGEPLVIVSVAGQEQPVLADRDGILWRILVAEGEFAAVGAVLAHLGRSARATPLAGRLMDKLGLEASAIGGTGPRGLVMRRDLRRLVRSSEPSILGAIRPAGLMAAGGAQPGLPARAGPPRWGAAEELPAGAGASEIGSQPAAVAQARPGTYRPPAGPFELVIHQADMTAILASLQDEARGASLGGEPELKLAAVIVHAASRSLRDCLAEHRLVGKVTLGEDQPIDVEIASPADGQARHVVRGADRLTVAAIESQLARPAIGRSEDASVRFPGVIFAILPPTAAKIRGVLIRAAGPREPQIAVLACGAIVKQCRVLEADHGDLLAIRSLLLLSLAFDPRVVDLEAAEAWLLATARKLESHGL